MKKTKKPGNVEVSLAGDELAEEGLDIYNHSGDGNPKCKYSPELKMRVVLDSLRGDRTQVSVSEQHNVSQPLISVWKRRALQAMMTALAADYRREGGRRGMVDSIISKRDVGETVNLSSELLSLRSTIFRLASALESAELGKAP